MKKFFIGIITASLIVTLSLTGCTTQSSSGSVSSKSSSKSSSQSNSTSVSIPENFKTTAEIKFKDVQATAVLVKQDPKTLDITFQSPPALKDIHVICKKDIVNISYKGIGFDFNPDEVPTQATKLLLTALNAAAQKEGITVSLDGSKVTVAGTSADGEFTLSFDKKSGNILTIDVPSAEFHASFLNFDILS